MWIVDGPEIRMDYGLATLPFPTRMVVVRLTSGHLWLHSPIAPDNALFDAIDALGEVRHLVAPNSIHYWYMADWVDRYPSTVSYAVADLLRKAKRPFRVDHLLRDGESFPWESEIDWVEVPGTAVTEAVFHVPAASTVILADMIENFEAGRIRGWFHRLLVRFGSADGGTPRDLRLTFWPRRHEVAARVARILAWRPDRIVMAHGRPISRNGAVELERALRWAL